jgi:hypothetical protein
VIAELVWWVAVAAVLGFPVGWRLRTHQRRSPSAREFETGQKVIAAMADGLAQARRSPRDAREGLDPADPANRALLGVCPICGLDDRERFEVGLGVKMWRGWPAHDECVEWLGAWEPRSASAGQLGGCTMAEFGENLERFRCGFQTANENRSRLGYAVLPAAGSSARLVVTGPRAGEVADRIEAGTGTRPLTGPAGMRVTSVSAGAAAQLSCAHDAGTRRLYLSRAIGHPSLVTVGSGEDSETVGVAEACRDLGDFFVLPLAAGLTRDHGTGAPVAPAEHAVQASPFGSPPPPEHVEAERERLIRTAGGKVRPPEEWGHPVRPPYPYA